MLKLKEFRQTAGYTQDKIAEMLKTTQQTVARWESGKAEPSLAALRDLSVIFGTSVDDLLGRNPMSDTAVTNSLFSLDKGEGHFWGNLAIQIPGDRVSRWFPVTLREAKAVERSMKSVSAEEPWFAVPTLNDRMLLVNGMAVKHVGLLDDNADDLDGDWELGWDGYTGFPMEVYRALEDWYFDMDIESSDTFKKVIEDVIKEHELTPELVAERVTKTALHFKDGSTVRATVSPEHLWEAVFDLESIHEQPDVFDLSDDDGGFERYVPAASLIMVDMPLHHVIDAAKEFEESAEPEVGSNAADDAANQQPRSIKPKPE